MRRRGFLLLAAQGAAGCFSGAGSSEPALPSPSHEPLAPDPTPVSPLERHAEKLRAKHGRDGFTVLIEPPFVVAGDEEADVVQHRATTTVAWATKRLKEAYFAIDPPGPITVWLFRDAKSYNGWTAKLFGERPDTPYGYYSPDDEALIMDISTGGGTLVHEMVHPFIDANFPKCPAWFDEGLASLYEQCGEKDGRIVGFENWRLPGLQEALAQRATPSFEVLTHASSRAFYADDTGIYYAQARYLCFYLQHEGLLGDYYRAFTAAAAEDPSGYETLGAVLGRDDMTAFEQDWSKFVQALRYA